MSESLENFIDVDRKWKKKHAVIMPKPRKAIAVWRRKDGTNFSMLITVWPSEDNQYFSKNVGKKVENLLRQSSVPKEYWPATRDSVEVIGWADWESGDW